MTASLYRKYRPQTFAEVVGQDAIERTLRNAIAQNKVSHAYLFCGPRGTGKTTTARLMAKALLCKNGPTPDPDGTCEECLQIAEGMHPDVYELDAASRTGVENVREEIIGRVNFAPTRGRSKVYIIDEVHMLSVAAFNALLKTLEEPPAHVVFILCTTDPQKVPATIHSRCQRFDFHRISNEEIVSRLGAICVAEDVRFEPEALDLIAARSEGGMRNALTTLEQLIVFCEGNVSLAGAESLLGSLDAGDMAQVMEAVGRRDAAACFAWTADYVESGADLAQFVRDMTSHVRTLYVMSIAGEDAPVEITDEERKRCEIELPYYSSDRLARLLGILGELQNELRFSNNPRLSFEIALTRMVRPDSDITLEALAERVATLEKALAARPAAPVAVPAAAPVAAPAAAPAPAPAPRPVAPAPAPAPAPRPAAPAYSAPAPAPRAAAPAPRPAAPASAPAPRPAAAASAPRPAAPVPRAEVPASNGAIPNLKNPAALQRSWQSALNQVKKEKAAYGVFFLNTVVACDAAGESIVVTYPAGSTFAFDAVQKPEVQAVLNRAVAQAFGGPVPVHFVQEEGSARPAAPASRPAAPVPAPRAAAPAPRPAAPAPAPAPAPRPAAPAPRPAPRPAVDLMSAPVDDDPMIRRGPSRRSFVPVVAPEYDDYDEVPLDAYDSMSMSVPSDYDPGYYQESPHAVRGPANAAPIPAPAAPAPAPRSAAPAPRPAAPVPTPSPTPAPAPAQEEEAFVGESIEDIQNLLSSSFGNAIIFEEIDN